MKLHVLITLNTCVIRLVDMSTHSNMAGATSNGPLLDLCEKLGHEQIRDLFKEKTSKTKFF